VRGAHFWGREIGKLGHEVRLIPPADVKPFVRRQRNDGEEDRGPGGAAKADERRGGDLRSGAEAEHGVVPVKSEEKQGTAAVFRVREPLVRQRAQAINAARAGT
jgi:transposase